jgi:hypothetical protein
MKRILMLTIVLMGIFTAQAFAGHESSTNINVMLGHKQLDSGDWAPFENQSEVGFLMDVKAPYWVVSLAFEAFYSEKNITENGVDITGSTTEYSIGVKKIWERELYPVKPFVGGGFSSITAKFELNDNGYVESSSDTGIGYYVEGGVYISINDQVNLGVIGRYSSAQITLDGKDGEAGGSHAGFFVGAHF